jgi:ribosomal protein S6--L-glutamate ligase
MKPLRIGFLLPGYSARSHSHMPTVLALLADAGVVVEVVHPARRNVDLSEVRVEHDLYVLKKINGLAFSLAGALHARGARIVNPYTVSAALRDKIVTFRILQAAGVPTPATYAAPSPEDLAPLLDSGPLVVKPYQGTSGYGVRIIRTAAQLADVPRDGDPVFAQRYHAPDGRDRKLYVIGDRIFGTLKVFPALTQAEKHGDPFTPRPELCEIARRCGQAFGIDLYGVDIIESDGRPYVVDMSTMPGFKGVPEAPRLLADYFRGAAERAARGEPPCAIPPNPDLASQHPAPAWHLDDDSAALRQLAGRSSAQDLVLRALSGQATTPEELVELRRLLSRMT